MLTPAEARARMLAAIPAPMPEEAVPLADGLGRTLAHDLAALRIQPPFPASAMDGYAVRGSDIVPGRPLAVIGVSAAGRPFAGMLGPGQAVRIFTGAALPVGADTVIMQENVTLDGAGAAIPAQEEPTGRFVRPAGLDFREGDAGLPCGLVLAPRHIGLAASMGHASLPVRCKPRVSIISTGDELAPPGAALAEGQIVSSNAFALAAFVSAHGGEPADMGIVPDDLALTRKAIDAAGGTQIVITCGGASVGDHDVVQAALVEAGFSIDFWKVAIRPGKPLMFGRRGGTLAIGLPGNPVSSMVGAQLFLGPVLRAMLGQPGADDDRREPAVLGVDVGANDQREDYLRASLRRGSDGRWIATPAQRQDSSMQRVFAEAEALLIRPAHAPAARSGESCEIIRL